MSQVSPVQAVLVSVMDSARLKVGSSVLLKVAVPWSGAGCSLKMGTVIEGHVIELVMRSKTAPNARLQLDFETSECTQKTPKPVGFKLAALVGGSPDFGSGLVEATPLADVPGLSIGGGGSTGGGQLRSVQTASGLTNYSGEAVRPLPSRIKPGQVLAMPRVTLSLGTGIDGGTVILGVKQNLRFEPSTRFVLVADTAIAAKGASETAVAKAVMVAAPRAASAKVDGAEASARAEEARAAAERENVDEMEQCEGGCAVVDAKAVVGPVTASRAAGTLSLRALGFAPRLVREVARLDDETTLTWLDGTHLLCTFDPHQLRARGGGPEASRTIKAIVIDAETRQVVRTLKWSANGESRYLWPLSGGRILVHQNNQLRIFDASLKPLHSFLLTRPLAWVAASPGGDHFAVAETEERHTPEIHERLKADGREPEEDLAVSVLNGELKTLFTTERSSAEPRPVLTDQGELRLKRVSRDHWKINEYGWDRSAHALTATRSTCRPALSATAGGLVYAVGCMTSGGHWFRMLRPDGHPLLKGEAPSFDVIESSDTASHDSFALRTVEAKRAMSFDQPFKRDDLAVERIAIYRSSDGGFIADFRSSNFTLSAQSYALSPDGRMLASMGEGEILFYRVN